MINKPHWLDIAELIDSYRVVPRVFLFACFGWTVEITRQLLQWYTHIPSEQRSIEASGFASVVFLTVFGFLKLVFSEYSANGRDWSGQSQTTTTVATQQTIQK